MNDCVFCKIINKELPASIINETESIMTFLSLENHPLVISKKHIKDIHELDYQTGAEVMKEMINTSNVVKEKLNCDGVYIDQRNGVAAGQEVFHIHFHIYPRWNDQTLSEFTEDTKEARMRMFDALTSSL